MDLPDAFYCVGENAWLACAAGLTARWYGLGLAWGWVFGGAGRTPRPAGIQWLVAAAQTVLLGVLLSLLTAWGLAEAGVYRPVYEWTALAGLAAVGMLYGYTRQRATWCAQVRRGLPGLAALFGGIALLMVPPARGEWIMGGWDPGVYVNQGVAVARTGTFHAPPDPLLSALEPDERALFVRAYGDDYRELLPGFPLDAARCSLQPYFFRMTPTVIAVAQRAGGLRAATRVVEMIGWLAVLLFAAMLVSVMGRGVYAAFSVLCFALQPAFLYHLHTPVSDMLELWLVCGGVLIVATQPVSRGRTGLLMALCAVGMLNRVSFFAVGGLLLVALAWGEAADVDRRRVGGDVAALGLVLLGGLVLDGRLSAMMPRLRHVLPFLLASGLTLLTVAVGIVALRRRGWQTTQRVGMGLTPVIFLLGAAGLGVWGLLDRDAEWLINIRRMIPYWTGFALGAAGWGVAWWMRRAACEECTPLGWGLIVCGGAGLMALLCQKWIAELYPWASRRFLVFGTPLLAFFAGAGPAWLWARLARHVVWRTVMLAGMAAALVVGGGRQAVAAWARTEYDGASAALRQVAVRLKADDCVVADHFLWATPLRGVYDFQTLDGSVLGARRDPAQTRAAWAALERVHRTGRRIVFLTTKPAGLARYAEPPGVFDEIGHAEPFQLRELVHHREASGFVRRAVDYELRLYEWRPL